MVHIFGADSTSGFKNIPGLKKKIHFGFVILAQSMHVKTYTTSGVYLA